MSCRELVCFLNNNLIEKKTVKTIYPHQKFIQKHPETQNLSTFIYNSNLRSPKNVRKHLVKQFLFIQ